MQGVIRIIRDNEVKMTLPGASVKLDNNGYIWYFGVPVLGITDPAVKARVAADVKGKRYDRIPEDAWVRMGVNANGVEAVDDKAWATHPAKIRADVERQARDAEQTKQVSIYLSSRGWGDYSSLEWHGDITRPDAEILAECKTLLANGYDVDKRNQTDADIMALIVRARKNWEEKPAREAARKAAYEADIQSKIDSGYCFACESWCHGDCGHYSNDPMTQITRNAHEAAREQNYGIND